MKESRATWLLVLLIVTALAGSLLAADWMSGRRDAAGAADAALARVRRDAAEVARLRKAVGGAAGMDAPELSRKLRSAAAAAGLADLPGTEPYPPVRIGDSDYVELRVALRFEPLTLRQLVLFLHHLSNGDPAGRTVEIELSPPERGGQSDLWTADVAVAYTTWSPRQANR